MGFATIIQTILRLEEYASSNEINLRFAFCRFDFISSIESLYIQRKRHLLFL